MSNNRIKKSMAIEQIDTLLDKELEHCVVATYNELIHIIDTAEKAGVKKKKGTIVVGYHPFDHSYIDILFDIENDALLEIWQSSLRIKRTKIKSLAKYSKKYDLHCMDIDDHPYYYHGFAFKFYYNCIIPRRTKTGKLFIQKLSQLLDGRGIKLSFKSAGLIMLKINYTYKKPKTISSPTHSIQQERMSIDSVRKTLLSHFSRFDDVYEYSETDDGGMCTLDVEIPELHQRVVRLAILVDATANSMWSVLTFGRVPANQVASAASLAEQFNAGKSADDFEVEITDPTDDGFDGQLMFMKSDTFKNTPDLQALLGQRITESMMLCKSSELLPFLNVTTELN